MGSMILPRRRDPRHGLRRALRASEDTAARLLNLTAGAWLVGLLVTAVIVLGPVIPVNTRSTSLHLVLSTANACIALFAAYLIHGRFRRDVRYQDLLLAQGLILLGIAGLGLAWAGDFRRDPALGGFADWFPLTLRALGGLLIAVASLVPTRW